MGMSTHVVGVRKLDGQFAKMITVKLACEAAGVTYPNEVKAYFGRLVSESPESLQDEMTEVPIDSIVKHTSRNSSDVYELLVADIGSELEAIRFINSY